ncbi:MAG: prephenate dehydratase [Anaerolineales bacterium]|nr:prephenate dehydratase [Anaerolineales bacterium]MCB0012236.1 prephenate dehydratase [Anaerolineales bacterium]MCB0017923.1 prephenate dehydratase [Anaerolineales bacterium]MCB0029954.1 prephenate dehydratase [Anaerolineales bacterium]
MSKTVVAFQGTHGAYSEQAIRQHFGPEVKTLPSHSFADIFNAIRRGEATHGMVAVENSLAGTVIPAYDQLMNHDLRIQAEVVLRVEHCLLAPAGTALADIKQARSHPQALAQCEKTLQRLGIEPVVHYDTAGAAADLAAQPEPGIAAIASALAGETYGLAVISRNMEDLPFNYTRFFLLAAGDPPRSKNSKTSIIFATRHVPSALYQVLGELANQHINITKIESRPRRDQPWSYLFYLDFEGHEDDPYVQQAMLGILKKTSFLKLLGSFPAAPALANQENSNGL